VTLTPVDDAAVESTQTATMTLASGTGYTVGTPASASGSITDNDTAAVLTLTATDTSGAEQGADPIVFTLTRTTNFANTLVVNLTWSGTATYGTDFTATATGGTLSANGATLTVAAGSTGATITVTPVDDAMYEGAEAVSVTVASGTGYTVGSPASATGSIADNDAAPVVAVTAADASGAEQASDPISFTVSRTATLNGSIAVGLT
jgi:hypothetical protein